MTVFSDEISLMGRQIPLYSLCTMAGMALACLYFERRAQKLPCDTADVEQTFLWGGIGCLAGAKALSLLTQIPALAADWPVLFRQPALFAQKYLYAGFVFYGGLYGGLLGGLLYMRRNEMSITSTGQALVPVCPLIHAFGRMGCFFTGCCFGCRAPAWVCGVQYKNSAIAPNHTVLLPVQLYEAAVELLLFVWLAQHSRRGMSGERLLYRYLSSYAVARFLLEFLRGDTWRGFIGPLSISQWISLLTLVVLCIAGAGTHRLPAGMSK